MLLIKLCLGNSLSSGMDVTLTVIFGETMGAGLSDLINFRS